MGDSLPSPLPLEGQPKLCRTTTYGHQLGLGLKTGIAIREARKPFLMGYALFWVKVQSSGIEGRAQESQFVVYPSQPCVIKTPSLPKLIFGSAGYMHEQMTPRRKATVNTND